MRILSAALAALLFIAMPAQTMAADIKVLTPDIAVALATAVGGTNVQRKDADGQTVVVFEHTGKTYVFSLELCDKDDKSKCGGLLMAMGFKSSDTVETFNNFNKAIGFVTAVKLDNETMAFGRYVVALGGITAENIGANFGLLTIAPELYGEFAKSQIISSIGANGQVLLSQANPEPAALQPVALTIEQVKSMANDALAAKAKLKLK